MMNTLREKLVKFLKSEDGPTAVEYAVMVALIIVVSIAAITTLGTKVKDTFTKTAADITTATTAS
jgi:pilus assembly protein Flp/PilA